MTVSEETYWSTRTCIVTGGARGQGAEEVKALLSLGAAVVAIDMLPEQGPEWRDLRSASQTGAMLLSIEGDVSGEDTWERALKAVGSVGRPLAGLINNAGITLRKTVTETSLDEWNALLNVNLTGSFMGIHSVAAHIEEGGAIVNVSSTAGLTGYFSAAYTASKWAVRGLAKAAAIELAPRGIRVNTICPGLVDTPMAMSANSEYDAHQADLFYEGNRQMTPLSRGALPAEIAEVAVFLLGPRASFVNAADITVDGGMMGGGIYSYIGRQTGSVGGASSS